MSSNSIYTAIDRTPYTYLIKFIPTGQLYYGVRTAVGCCPEDLWVTYFTSSRVIKSLIKEFGPDSFSIEHVLPHESRSLALEFEELVLLDNDAAKSDKWLNRSNGAQNFVCTGHSEKTKANYRINNAGTKNGMYGKTHTPEARERISKCRSGSIQTEETKRKISIGSAGVNNGMYGKRHTEESKKQMSANKIGKNTGGIGETHYNSQKWIITFPDDHIEIITGLRGFCRTHNLYSSNMGHVAAGLYKQHKGFKCAKFTES